MLGFSMWVGGNLSFGWGSLSKKGQNFKKITLKFQLFRLAMGGTGPPYLHSKSVPDYSSNLFRRFMVKDICSDQEVGNFETNLDKLVALDVLIIWNCVLEFAV